MFDTRLATLPDQADQHAHDHHQLVMSLSGRAEFEIGGTAGEVCRMRACLVPGDVGHQFAGLGDNRMLIVDLTEAGTGEQDRELLARLFEMPRYPTLDADFQNLLSYAGAEIARYGDDPLLARAWAACCCEHCTCGCSAKTVRRATGRWTWSGWTAISPSTFPGALPWRSWRRSPA